MKNCIYCGQPLPDEAAFCHHCAGSQLSKQLMLPPKRRSARSAALPAVACISLCLLLLGSAAVRSSFAAPEITEPTEETAPELQTDAVPSRTTAPTPELQTDAVPSRTAAPTEAAEASGQKWKEEAIFLGRMPAMEAAYSFAPGAQARLDALPYDYMPDLSACIEDALSLQEAAMAGNLQKNEGQQGAMTAGYIYTIDGKTAAQKICYANGDQEFVVYYDFNTNKWARHLSIYANGSWEDCYFYPSGITAVRYSLSSGGGRYGEVYYYDDGTQSCFVNRTAESELLTVFAPDNGGSVSVEARDTGTGYTVRASDDTYLSYTQYDTDGSSQEQIFENGSVVKTIRRDPQGNERT